MSWYKPKTTKVTLEKFEAPDIVIEVLDVNALPYGKAKELTKEWTRINEMGDKVSLEDQDAGMKIMFKQLVSAWNITDPYDDSILPLPKDDPSVIEKLPLEVLFYVANEAFGGDKEPVPPVNGNEPSISS